MIHALAVRLSAYFAKRGWIEKNQNNWCVYALEKRLGLLVLLSFITIWMIFSHLYLETVSFLAPLYLLRRRIGGWHAKKAMVCFGLSVGIVVIFSSFFGRLISELPPFVLLALDVLLILFALSLHPEYPPQLSFTEEEKTENYRIKNRLLLFVFLIQCFFLVCFDSRVLAHSFCAVVICVVAVLLQKQKGRAKMNKLEKLASKAVNTIIGIEINGWPPICFGTFYQPKRPTENQEYPLSLPKKTIKEKSGSIDPLRKAK